jgi:hypothetical protein
MDSGSCRTSLHGGLMAGLHGGPAGVRDGRPHAGPAIGGLDAPPHAVGLGASGLHGGEHIAQAAQQGRLALGRRLRLLGLERGPPQVLSRRLNPRE